MDAKDQIYYKRNLTGTLKQISDLSYSLVAASPEDVENIATEIRRLNDKERERHRDF